MRNKRKKLRYQAQVTDGHDNQVELVADNIPPKKYKYLYMLAYILWFLSIYSLFTLIVFVYKQKLVTNQAKDKGSSSRSG